MGESYSKEDEAREEVIFVYDLFSVAQTSGLMPDIGIDDTLLKFSGMNSTAVLQDYSSQLSMDLAGKAPDYIASLGSTLANFKGVSNAVGLGALVISLILDLAVSSIASQNSDSTLNMLRRVFAEEKASGVRDTMDEYMKRLSMHMKVPLKAHEETERLEKQLSDQLTRLRNSMLHDDQINSRAMKYWINGAAFHSQMLVHAARLKIARSSPVIETDLEVQMFSISRVVEIYQGNLQELLKKYKTYKRKTIRHVTPSDVSFCYGPACGVRRPSCAVQDRESNLLSSFMYKNNYYCYRSQDAYVDYMFNNWHVIKQMNEFFFNLQKNLKELILQHQAFSG